MPFLFNQTGIFVTPAIGQGGTIQVSNIGGTTYAVHTFTGNGYFTPPALSTAITYIVVGGGGGGGSDVSNSNPPTTTITNGGGGGGFVTGNTTTNGLSVTVGSGGAGGAIHTPGNPGQSSKLGTITATGGLAGYSYGNNAYAGGGGTASSITGTTLYYNARGGSTFYPGGNGGGAGALPSSDIPALPGTFYGAGGGAGGYSTGRGQTYLGAPGYNGVVIIRYTTNLV